MKKQYSHILLLFLPLVSLTSISNGQDKSKFEKTFLNETSQSQNKSSNKFRNITKLSFYPDTLPTWFFAPPLSTINCIYAVGISDPDMESGKGKEMAIHRAKAMAGLYINSKLQYFRDVYTSDKQSGKYSEYRQRFDTYFKISSMSKLDDASFAVVDSHMTRYNESMILIKYSPKDLQVDGSNLLSVVGTVLYIEAQVSEAFEVQAEYELLSAFRQSESSTQSAHYLYREKGNKFLSNSEFLSSKIEFPVYIYKYAAPNWDKNTVPLISYNGLWSKFTRELLRDLTLTTQQTKTRIRNLGEKYNPASSNLSREIVSFYAQLKLNGIVFESDTMKIDISINEINLQKK
jgi:hypothetical protein